MNKELALILANRLVGLPFVQVLAGMVQTVTSSDPGENDAMAQKKYPVSSDTNIPETCRVTPEMALIPNSGRASIIYFEDFGSRPARNRGRFQVWTSSLRLVCWFNKKKLYENPGANTAAVMIAQIKNKIETPRPTNFGLFQRVTINAVNIPIQDAAIFGRYSYNEEDRQYLRPPFDFFAIDFNVNFEINEACLQTV